jgi:hypothetical protein
MLLHRQEQAVLRAAYTELGLGLAVGDDMALRDFPGVTVKDADGVVVVERVNLAGRQLQGVMLAMPRVGPAIALRARI